MTNTEIFTHDSDPPASTGWTDDRVAKLKTLYENGLSCSKIAVELGEGLTRNAIIGKIHRLDLERRGAGWTDAPPREVRSRKPRLRVIRSNQSTGLRLVVMHDPASMPGMRCVEVEPRNLTLLELEAKDCRYPYGDGSAEQPYVFCGHAKESGSSYCQAHHSLTEYKFRNISAAEQERRRQHFIGLLTKKSARTSEVFA